MVEEGWRSVSEETYKCLQGEVLNETNCKKKKKKGGNFKPNINSKLQHQMHNLHMQLVKKDIKQKKRWERKIRSPSNHFK